MGSLHAELITISSKIVNCSYLVINFHFREQVALSLHCWHLGIELDTCLDTGMHNSLCVHVNNEQCISGKCADTHQSMRTCASV